MTKAPHKIFNLLSGPALLHYTLPVVMTYLIAGTIAQKYMGLYQATKLFFSEPVIWLNNIPLPGFPVFVALIFMNLTLKLLFKSPWTARNAGIIITHMGVGTLLLGAFFTGFYSTEGYMDLSLNKPKSAISDYHAREFVLLDEADNIIKSFRHEELSEGQEINFGALPLKAKILETCRNCDMLDRPASTPEYRDIAKHLMIKPKETEKNDEENMAGLTFAITGNSPEKEIYLLLENLQREPEFKFGTKTYRLSLRREARPLPFSVELKNFKRETHPGTDLPSAYASTISIIDGNARWESTVEMNQPLRYKGYSFYQSSFIDTPQGPVSVLAVVWNAGRVFPYVAGITICIGIILHLGLRRKTRQATFQGKIQDAP